MQVILELSVQLPAAPEGTSGSEGFSVQAGGPRATPAAKTWSKKARAYQPWSFAFTNVPRHTVWSRASFGARSGRVGTALRSICLVAAVA